MNLDDAKNWIKSDRLYHLLSRLESARNLAYELQKSEPAIAPQLGFIAEELNEAIAEHNAWRFALTRKGPSAERNNLQFLNERAEWLMVVIQNDEKAALDPYKKRELATLRWAITRLALNIPTQGLSRKEVYENHVKENGKAGEEEETVVGTGSD